MSAKEVKNRLYKAYGDLPENVHKRTDKYVKRGVKVVDKIEATVARHHQERQKYGAEVKERVTTRVKEIFSLQPSKKKGKKKAVSAEHTPQRHNERK